MIKKRLFRRKTAVQIHSEVKEQECATAVSLSLNLDEAVEQSIVKFSSDEARSTSR